MTSVLLLLVFLPQTLALTVSAQDLVEQELRIPISDGLIFRRSVPAHGAGKKGLDAVMVRPSEPGPHPLALINHGVACANALGLRTKRSLLFSPASCGLLPGFHGGGGKVRFVRAYPFGADGHTLFSPAGMPIWTPMADVFLQSQNLVLRKTLLNLPDASASEPASTDANQ
jgi:hypothetical protein